MLEAGLICPHISPLLPLVCSLYDTLDSFNPTYHLLLFSRLDAQDSFDPTYDFFPSLAGYRGSNARVGYYNNPNLTT